MTSGAHDAGGGFGRSAGANAARGVMVIVLAVVVGVVLMNRGLGDNSGTVDASQETGSTTSLDTTAEQVSTTATSQQTTVATQPARDPSEVAVLVLNGTQGEDGKPITGVAGRGTDLLKENNYITRLPKNADAAGPSLILYAEGFEAEANEVALVFGVDPVLVVQPLDPASPLVADSQEADIVVRVGDDGLITV